MALARRLKLCYTFNSKPKICRSAEFGMNRKMEVLKMKHRKFLSLLLALALMLSLASVGFAAGVERAEIDTSTAVRTNVVPAWQCRPTGGANELQAHDVSVLLNATDIARGVVKNSEVTLEAYFAAAGCGTRDTAFGMSVYEGGLDNEDGSCVYDEAYYFNPGSNSGTVKFTIPKNTLTTVGDYSVYFDIFAVNSAGEATGYLYSASMLLQVTNSSVSLKGLKLLRADGSDDAVSEISLAPKKEAAYYISFDPSNYTGGRSYTFTNSDPSVAEVEDFMGWFVVTAKAAGTTRLTLKSNGKTLTVPIVVKVPVTDITVNHESLRLCTKQTVSIAYKVVPTGAAKVGSSIQDTSVAKITGRDNDSGMIWVSGVSAGDTFLKLKADTYEKNILVTVVDHKLVEIERAEPTCTDSGRIVRKCAVCGETSTEILPALGHELDEKTVTQAPTATKPGFEQGHCSRCGQSDVQNVLPAIFKDTAPDAYYSDALDQFYAAGLVKGMTADTFGPRRSMTRGEIVTLLYRMSGETVAEDAQNPFSDVAEGRYYYDAVLWASANGIVNGYPEGTFRPKSTITRQEMATFLYRYAQHRGMDVSARGDLSIYRDADRVLPYAQDALSWAVGSGLIKGMNATELAPRGGAVRAQCVTILYRYQQAFEASDGE